MQNGQVNHAIEELAMQVKKRIFSSFVLLLTAAQVWPVLAQAESGTVQGKNDWLYFRYERLEPADQSETKVFAEMVKKVNRLLQENGTEVLVSVTPLKMQLYPENLPSSFQLAPGMADHYPRFINNLRSGGVYVVDQLTSFASHAKDNPAFPLFLRLDSHWAPSGAVLAAKNIRQSVESNPALKKVWEPLPVVNFKLSPVAEPVVSRVSDLIPNLPKGVTPPAPEKILTYTMVRPSGAQLDSEDQVGITAIGSSFTDKMTHYPNALRSELQRDILDISIPGRQGPWVGMEHYVSSPAFQLQRPKLLIWEIPERDVANPPNSPWREERYRRDNTDWLVKVATQIKKSCTPSPVGIKSQEARLANNGSSADGKWIVRGVSGKDSFLELHMDKPLQVLDYIAFDYAAKGSDRVRVEAHGANGRKDQWLLTIPDEGERFDFKTSFPAASGPYQKVRIYPGDATDLSIGQPKVCRHESSLMATN